VGARRELALQDRRKAGEQVRARQGRIRREMDLSRISWIATVLVAVLIAVLLLLSGYTGYAALSIAVAGAAAINLL
jgi:hypothetical protein